MSEQNNEILFTEIYRPKTVSECVLPLKLKNKFESFAKSGNIPNMLLVGGSGLGKTTVARALCNEVGVDSLFINASLEGNIDVLRNKIMRFASSVSLFSEKRKIVILDEADYLNKQSTQPALRAFMEEYSNNCGFILTCNFQNRLITPLHSRSAVFHFDFPKPDTDEGRNLGIQFFKRAGTILDDQGIEWDKKVLSVLVKKYYPDFRAALNELQSYSQLGKIDSGILSLAKNKSAELVPHLKSKDFKSMRQWASDNGDIDTTELFRNLYDNLYEFLVPATIPQAVLILNEGQKADAIVADKELNLVATLTDLMASVEFTK